MCHTLLRKETFARNEDVPAGNFDAQNFFSYIFKKVILLPPQERGAERLRIHPLNLMQVMLP